MWTYVVEVTYLLTYLLNEGMDRPPIRVPVVGFSKPLIHSLYPIFLYVRSEKIRKTRHKCLESSVGFRRLSLG